MSFSVDSVIINTVANMRVLLIKRNILYKNMLNIKGPNMEPWGTPSLICVHLLNEYFT